MRSLSSKDRKKSCWFQRPMAELLNYSIDRHYACSSRPYDFKKWNIITTERTGTLIIKVHQTTTLLWKEIAWKYCKCQPNCNQVKVVIKNVCITTYYRVLQTSLKYYNVTNIRCNSVRGVSDEHVDKAQQ